MQEKELKPWEEIGISQEQWEKAMKTQEILIKACEILEEHPNYISRENGEYVCIPNAPYEVEVYVKHKNYMNELLNQKK